ncbi:hypothetical protein BT69DRAFT_1296477 [Atractiella rhizophila]|nr:hypothetical protein BT69DRAFT_1296477 [Atractiella rhizophila]
MVKRDPSQSGEAHQLKESEELLHDLKENLSSSMHPVIVMRRETGEKDCGIESMMKNLFQIRGIFSIIDDQMRCCEGRINELEEELWQVQKLADKSIGRIKDHTDTLDKTLEDGKPREVHTEIISVPGAVQLSWNNLFLSTGNVVEDLSIHPHIGVHDCQNDEPILGNS